MATKKTKTKKKAPKKKVKPSVKKRVITKKVIKGKWAYNPAAIPDPIIESIVPPHDPVNRPSHYTDGKIEVIDFIEDKQLGFHLGNTVKYIARAGKKEGVDPIQDLEKAQWYLNRYIDKLKNEDLVNEE